MERFYATAAVLEEIDDERARQHGKWGEQNHADIEWFAILAEEFGEVARSIVGGPLRTVGEHGTRHELIQVAAVAVAWVEAIDR